MSTKQRGDVEKVAEVAKFKVHLNPCDPRYLVSVTFTRDEFRRIWEAGEKEFGREIDRQLGTDLRELREANKELQEDNIRLRAEVAKSPWSGSLLAEKAAEIARLRRENARLEGRPWKASYQAEHEEVLRLRGWLEKMKCKTHDTWTECGARRRFIDRALAGEKVPSNGGE